MAAGDRNNKDKPKDIVKHYGKSPICGQLRWGYSSEDFDETSCKNCLSILLNKASEVNSKFKIIFKR